MRQIIIRRSFASLLLTVFVLCNAPTNLLHTLFADHKDQVVSVVDERPGDRITTAGFTCKFAPHVVTTPFVTVTTPATIKSPEFTEEQQKGFKEKVIKKEHAYSSLRAPPALEIA